MKVLLIGQAPAAHHPLDPPLGGATGRRMARILRITFEDYLEQFDRWNLLAHYPGPGDAKGDAFPIAEARENAVEVAQKLKGRDVVFLGGAVARAFNVGHIELLKWHGFEYIGTGIKFHGAIFPHPSGINRWWNEAANVGRAERFAERWLTR